MGRSQNYQFMEKIQALEGLYQNISIDTEIAGTGSCYLNLVVNPDAQNKKHIMIRIADHYANDQRHTGIYDYYLDMDPSEKGSASIRRVKKVLESAGARKYTFKVFQIFDRVAKIVKYHGDSDIICGDGLYCAAELFENNHLPQTGTLLVLNLPPDPHKIKSDGCTMLVEQPFGYIFHVAEGKTARIELDLTDPSGFRKSMNLSMHYKFECVGGKAPTLVERR